MAEKTKEIKPKSKAKKTVAVKKATAKKSKTSSVKSTIKKDSNKKVNDEIKKETIKEEAKEKVKEEVIKTKEENSTDSIETIWGLTSPYEEEKYKKALDVLDILRRDGENKALAIKSENRDIKINKQIDKETKNKIIDENNKELENAP